nr:hypothetical protein [Tanacetum cinerariifolium]
VPATPSTAAVVSVLAAPSTAVAVSVPAAPSTAAAVSVPAAPSVHADTEVHADESRLDDTQTASEHASTEHTVDESTPSSSRTRRDLRVLFQSLADEDAHAFWRNQDSWRIRSWRLYPRAQVHVLETVEGRVIYMFVDVCYPLSAATLKCMLKHGLEVLKLLVGGDLTMAEQLVSFIKAALLNAQSAV